MSEIKKLGFGLMRLPQKSAAQPQPLSLRRGSESLSPVRLHEEVEAAGKNTPRASLSFPQGKVFFIQNLPKTLDAVCRL